MDHASPLNLLLKYTRKEVCTQIWSTYMSSGYNFCYLAFPVINMGSFEFKS